MGEVEVCIWGINYHECLCGLHPATRRKQLQDDRAKGLRAGWPLCLPCSLSSLSAPALPAQVLGSPGTAPGHKLSQTARLGTVKAGGRCIWPGRGYFPRATCHHTTVGSSLLEPSVSSGLTRGTMAGKRWWKIGQGASWLYLYFNGPLWS